jgi:hypothetical protein
VVLAMKSSVRMLSAMNLYVLVTAAQEAVQGV